MRKRITGEAAVIKIDDLVPNPIQPPDRITESAVKTLTETIIESNYIAPIIVMKSDRRGKFVVLDGHRRFTVAQRLGDDNVRCEVLPTSSGTPEVWFVWLNGGIRNVTGMNWFYVWAASEEPDRTFDQLHASTKKNITEMINVFGRDRALEIGRTSAHAPSRVRFINGVINILQRYELLPEPTLGQRRRVGEWLLKHKQTNAVNQMVFRGKPTKRTAEKFYHAIQRDRPVLPVRERAKRQPVPETAQEEG